MPRIKTIHSSICVRLSMSNERVTFVSHSTEDRQWDARFNVQRDEDLAELVANIKRHYESGVLRYILVGGPEIGTRPFQDDYQIRHVHVAAIFNNRISKRSILQHWGVKVCTVSAVGIHYVLIFYFVDWKRLLSCSEEPKSASLRMAQSPYQNILQG